MPTSVSDTREVTDVDNNSGVHAKPEPAPTEHPDTVRLRIVQERKWCLIPPNQESETWTVFRRFDGEFGYENEIGRGLTAAEAIDAAITAGPEVQPK